jgi:4-amino-4-deoxy-L-arabinose transferase-like glycosyltransferase
MQPSRLSKPLVVLAFFALAFLYCYRLAEAPIYLAHDEAMFGVVAHEIGWHARDLDGHALPLMMPMNGVCWNMPAHVYLTAAFVRLFGTTEAVIRASSATASLLAVFLIYVFARRVFGHRGFAMLAAATLALSPAFFIDSRLSTDHHYPVVAIGLWLICLARYFEDPSADVWLALAGVSLGAGMYTYGAAVLLMPLYVALTGLTLLRARVLTVRPYAALAVAFGIAVLPFAFFLLRHPAYVGDVANMYKVYDAKRFGVLQGARELLGWTSLGARADVFFSYFSPSMLFFSGAGSLIQSTRTAGFFLVPLLVLLPCAIVYVLRRDVEWYAWLALSAFVATPVTASIVDERGAVQRVMSSRRLPRFSSHISPCGSRLIRAWVRVGMWVLVASMPVVFALLHRTSGGYRRCKGQLEQNVRGALGTAIDEA